MGAKLLRKAFRGVALHTGDKRLVGRLVKEVMKVVKSDSTSVRGQRNLMDGDTTLLTGFEFNVNSPLEFSFSAPYVVTITRELGEFHLELPPFVPTEMITAPLGATHYKIMTAAADINFETDTVSSNVVNSAVLPIDNTPTAAFLASHVLVADSTNPLFVALGIAFYQEVNGMNYLLSSGSYNAAALVKVSHV